MSEATSVPPVSKVDETVLEVESATLRISFTKQSSCWRSSVFIVAVIESSVVRNGLTYQSPSRLMTVKPSRGFLLEPHGPEIPVVEAGTLERSIGVPVRSVNSLLHPSRPQPFFFSPSSTIVRQSPRKSALRSSPSFEVNDAFAVLSLYVKSIFCLFTVALNVMGRSTIWTSRRSSASFTTFSFGVIFSEYCLRISTRFFSASPMNSPA